MIIDDHAVVREGLRLRLEGGGAVAVIGDADTGRAGLELIRSLTPDVALLDIRLPELDGIGVASAAREEGLATRIIFFSSLSDQTLIERALDSGASGFIAKEARLDVVISAIGTVMAGRRFIDPTVAADLLHQRSQTLTRREQDILQLMADGHTNATIGERLSLADETVKSHVSTILRKLEATGRTGAVAEAFRRQLVR